jgi:hypothetical protein
MEDGKGETANNVQVPSSRSTTHEQGTFLLGTKRRAEALSLLAVIGCGFGGGDELPLWMG